MKKNNFILMICMLAVMIGFLPVDVFAEGDAPTGYTEITWVSEPGITTYMKAPPNIGYIDYLTVIDLSQNQIKLLSTSSSPRVLDGEAKEPFDPELADNWLFPRSLTESMKGEYPEVKFMWDGPFFNMNMDTTVLSLGLKSSDAEGAFISSGGRPDFDMEERRQMLLIDNDAGRATIAEFNVDTFQQEGDQGIEGFHSFADSSTRYVRSARVSVGVRNDGKELVVYCSHSASKDEASGALLDAGVLPEHQIQLDGGGSAMCGYNLPGQYFVESGRPLPHIMGAIPVGEKGTITIEGLNVRLGAGTNYEAVRKLSLGEEVTIYEEANGWMRISETEWVYAGYVHKIKQFPYEAHVTINNLNVRAGAGTSFTVTRRLALDETVTVLEAQDGWLRISESEWIFGTYAK